MCNECKKLTAGLCEKCFNSQSPMLPPSSNNRIEAIVKEFESKEFHKERSLWLRLPQEKKFLRHALQSYATEREEKIRQEILEMYKKEYTMTNPPTHNALFLETILALFQDKPNE